MDLFSELSFDGATTREIAARAGVTQPLLNYHFSSKDELWRAAVDGLFAELNQVLRGRAEGLRGVDDLTVARLVAREFIYFSAAHPQLHRIITQECKTDGPRMDWLVDRHIRPNYQWATDMFARLVDQGHLPDIPVAHLYYLLTGAGPTIFVLAPECRRLAGIDPQAPEVVEAHADAVIALIFGPPAKRRDTMKPELEVAYVGIEVPDPAVLTPFLADLVGLVPGENAGDAILTWRNDDKAHRVIVQPGPANDAVSLGVEAVDGVAFDRVVERLSDAGWPPAESPKADAAARRVARMAHVTAPWGIRLELVQGLESAPAPFTSPLVPGGFHTEGVGFGHAVFATTAFDQSHQFLTAGLGFAQSDWLEMAIGEGIELEVRFYHCNARHHSIALARAPFELPQKLHHLMFETNQRDDTGAAFDRAWASGLAIPNGLGRHDNDGMFSFYVASPAGFLVEVGHGARVITDGWDDNRRYDRISRWGHQSLRTP